MVTYLEHGAASARLVSCVSPRLSSRHPRPYVKSRPFEHPEGGKSCYGCICHTREQFLPQSSASHLTSTSIAGPTHAEQELLSSSCHVSPMTHPQQHNRMRLALQCYLHSTQSWSQKNVYSVSSSLRPCRGTLAWPRGILKRPVSTNPISSSRFPVRCSASSSPPGISSPDSEGGNPNKDNVSNLTSQEASSVHVSTPSPGSSIWGMFSEPIAARHPTIYYPGLMNRDFMPTLASERILNTWDIVSLWIGLVVGVPTWYLAGSLVELGMSWWQGILTVFAGNVIVLLPMLLNGHPGCKYGIPFPVLSRAAFGVYGANIPSLLRGLVACGWFGIQTWIGGQAISQLCQRLMELGQAQGLPGMTAAASWSASRIDALAISVLDLGSFLSFWFIQLGIVWNGIESIKLLEAYSAPILISLSVALLVWAVSTAGGFGPMLSAPSQFNPGQPKHGQFWSTFFPALTANVGFWATLSLNIPDFTRFARSQKVQALGQMLGLPPFMAAFSFVGLAVTSATAVIFGQVISDPIALLGRLQGLIPSLLSVIGLILATLTTNIAANVVAPANALVNLAPEFFSFRKAGLVTALLGVIMAPWRLVQSSDDFIFRWLIGYSALLGPVAGVVASDYFLVRRCELDVDALFSNSPRSEYWYQDGFNVRALVALAAGVILNLPGFLEAVGVVKSAPGWCKTVYGNAWIVGFTVSGIVHWVLMRNIKPLARQNEDLLGPDDS